MIDALQTIIYKMFVHQKTMVTVCLEQTSTDSCLAPVVHLCHG